MGTCSEFGGEHAYRQLGELYRALRLYINCFQPSMKLHQKHREGSHIQRTYDLAQTPLQRLLDSGVLDQSKMNELCQIAQALDPLRLLRQVEQLQHAVWQHAVKTTALLPPAVPPELIIFAVKTPHQPIPPQVAPVPVLARHKRHYHFVGPRYWRNRPDPFADVWEDIHATLQMHPDRTSVAIFAELQQRYPGRFPDCQIRTLQRGVGKWRAQTLLTFDEHLPNDVVGDAHEAPSLRLESPPSRT